MDKLKKAIELIGHDISDLQNNKLTLNSAYAIFTTYAELQSRITAVF